MFLPLIMGSDKTTNQEFHPFYGSPGVISSIARRGHGSGVLPYAMLPIPKGLLVLIPSALNSLSFQLLSDTGKPRHLKHLPGNYIMNVLPLYYHH
jgi:hypothetical protein